MIDFNILVEIRGLYTNTLTNKTIMCLIKFQFKGSDTRRAKHGAKHGTNHGAKHEAKHETLAYTNAKHRAKRETKHKLNPETFCETLRYNLL